MQCCFRRAYTEIKFQIVVIKMESSTVHFPVTQIK
jgi:hypothetical protein